MQENRACAAAALQKTIAASAAMGKEPSLSSQLLLSPLFGHEQKNISLLDPCQEETLAGCHLVQDMLYVTRHWDKEVRWDGAVLNLGASVPTFSSTTSLYPRSSFASDLKIFPSDKED